MNDQNPQPSTIDIEHPWLVRLASSAFVGACLAIVFFVKELFISQEPPFFSLNANTTSLIVITFVAFSFTLVLIQEDNARPLLELFGRGYAIVAALILVMATHRIFSYNYFYLKAPIFEQGVAMRDLDIPQHIIHPFIIVLIIGVFAGLSTLLSRQGFWNIAIPFALAGVAHIARFLYFIVISEIPDAPTFLPRDVFVHPIVHIFIGLEIVVVAIFFSLNKYRTFIYSELG